MTVQIPHIKKFKTRPQIYYQDIELCHSDLDLKLDLLPTSATNSLAETLADIYPTASLIEIYDWMTFFKSQNVNLDPNVLTSAFGFHWNDTAFGLFEVYSAWPDSFKHWARQKKAHINDLRPLLLLPKLDPENQHTAVKLIQNFESINPTLNQGKQILELFMDVAGHSTHSIEIKNLVESFTTCELRTELVLKKLLKLRYPLTTQLDQKNKNFAEKSIWPAPIKVNFKRLGDKAGFELSAFVTTSAQCQSAVIRFEDTLKSIAHHFESQIKNLETLPNGMKDKSYDA